MFEHMVFTSPRGKQIVFDDYCREDWYMDDDTVIEVAWVEICPHCHRKYRGILGNRCDDGRTDHLTCSVKGCNNQAHYYVDFNLSENNEVEFIMVDDEREGK